MGFKDLIFSNKVFSGYRKRRTTFIIGLVILLITKKGSIYWQIGQIFWFGKGN